MRIKSRLGVPLTCVIPLSNISLKLPPNGPSRSTTESSNSRKIKLPFDDSSRERRLLPPFVFFALLLRYRPNDVHQAREPPPFPFRARELSIPFVLMDESLGPAARARSVLPITHVSKGGEFPCAVRSRRTTMERGVSSPASGSASGRSSHPILISINDHAQPRWQALRPQTAL